MADAKPSATDHNRSDGLCPHNALTKRFDRTKPFTPQAQALRAGIGGANAPRMLKADQDWYPRGKYAQGQLAPTDFANLTTNQNVPRPSLGAATNKGIVGSTLQRLAAAQADKRKEDDGQEIEALVKSRNEAHLAMEALRRRTSSGGSGTPQGGTSTAYCGSSSPSTSHTSTSTS